jgi:hypothetical protein
VDSPLVGRDVLDEDEVRARLFNAVDPVWRAFLATLPAQPDVARPEEVYLLAQQDPLCVRVVRPARDDWPLLPLVTVRGDALPNDGRDLADALDACFAVKLDGSSAAGAGLAFQIADVSGGRGGGFAAVVWPMTGKTKALLGLIDREPLDLGEIGHSVSVN